jgi:DNA-binding MarR family transcriptional regulator
MGRASSVVFDTNILGLLDQHFLDSPFSLTEGRVLYEICNMEGCTARWIRENISIDEGYLSRILDSFVKQGLILKTSSPKDRRLRLILPTEKGRTEFSKLNNKWNFYISVATQDPIYGQRMNCPLLPFFINGWNSSSWSRKNQPTLANRW